MQKATAELWTATAISSFQTPDSVSSRPFFNVESESRKTGRIGMPMFCRQLRNQCHVFWKRQFTNGHPFKETVCGECKNDQGGSQVDQPHWNLGFKCVQKKKEKKKISPCPLLSKLERKAQEEGWRQRYWLGIILFLWESLHLFTCENTMQRREETQSRQDGDPVKPTMDTGGLMEAATGSSRRTLSSSRSRPQQSQPLSSCQSSGPWKDGRNLFWCSCGQENFPHRPTCFFKKIFWSI